MSIRELYVSSPVNSYACLISMLSYGCGWSSSAGDAIRCVVPVLLTTTCNLRIMARNPGIDDAKRNMSLLLVSQHEAARI